LVAPVVKDQAEAARLLDDYETDANFAKASFLPIFRTAAIDANWPKRESMTVRPGSLVRRFGINGFPMCLSGLTYLVTKS
jgi:hypothetical protein